MKKILLASSSEAFLERKTSLLRGRGVQLFTARSGAETLNLHNQVDFDLILSDLQLEDMCCSTLCSLVRSQEKACHVPIILICLNIPGRIDKAEQSGASAILLRPIDPVDLLEVIGSYLGLNLARSIRAILNTKVLIGQSNLNLTCFSSDICNTGILIESEYLFALASRVTCQFTLPGASTIITDGEVVRYVSTLHSKNLYGIKFIDLPLADSIAINNYLALTTNSETSSKVIMLQKQNNNQRQLSKFIPLNIELHKNNSR